MSGKYIYSKEEMSVKQSAIDRLTKENEQVKSDLLTLWGLLDDISTAGDMFKPEISPYFKYVNITCEQRSTVATSDGYEVFYKGEALK